MKSIYGVLMLGLFSTISTNALAAEPIACDSPNHNACFLYQPEEIPTVIDYDMCQYRQRAGISTMFENGTYFVTVDPSAPGAAGVPLAFVPEHNGEWESWEQLNDAFEQLLFGAGCHGTPLPPFPTTDLCNPLGSNFNFDFRANVNWLDPSTGELMPEINRDAFYGAFTDVNGRIHIPDVGVFDLSGKIKCAVGGAEHDGDILTVKQCSKIVDEPASRVFEIPCGPNGKDERFVSFFESPTSRNYFEQFALNGVPTVVGPNDTVSLYVVDSAELESRWFRNGSLFDNSTKGASNTPPIAESRTQRDGTCGRGRVEQAGFGIIKLTTFAGTGSCQ